MNARFITVPAGTKPTTCRGPNCHATMYWARDGGRAIPVDCDVEGGKRPSESAERGQLDAFSQTEAPVYDGKGVSHFATCPDADRFRGGAA